MVRVWVGDMRGAQSRWCIADVGIQFFIHNLSMQISVPYCLTSKLPTNRLENSWNLGQGFFVVTDGGDWVTELHSLQVCLFIYQKHRAKIIITFMNYWKFMTFSNSGHRWSHLCGPVRCSTQPSIALQDAQVWRVLHAFLFQKNLGKLRNSTRTIGHEWKFTSRIIFLMFFLIVCVILSSWYWNWWRF